MTDDAGRMTDAERLIEDYAELAPMTDTERMARRLEDYAAWMGNGIDAPMIRDAAALLRALAQDAERYRLIKDRQIMAWKPPHYDGYPRGRWDCFWPTEISDLDAAIDADIAKEKP